MKQCAIILVLLLTILAGTNLPQSSEVLKKEAQKHMQAGRYGEAIDLLNLFNGLSEENQTILVKNQFCKSSSNHNQQ